MGKDNNNKDFDQIKDSILQYLDLSKKKKDNQLSSEEENQFDSIVEKLKDFSDENVEED